ncbi:MAG TPA: NAD(P)H-hydrate dehydratase [Candidatus Kapabacteria bacterium]|nr:NAD(P)H-hydrate dehydratase [Candidatus Kapabacteria bacterium]
MIILLNSEQSKKIDSFATNKIGIPSILLMENAAISASNFIMQNIKQNHKILLLCGKGNNGGDGLAIARHLINHSYSNISIYIVGNSKDLSSDCSINFKILQNMNINIGTIDSTEDIESIGSYYDVVIDSILGVGLNGKLKEPISQLIAKINQFNAKKFAIDVPTGLDSDLGKADINTFKADFTLTMYSHKVGLYINHGRMYSGQIVTAYLGISERYLAGLSTEYILEDKDIKELAPKRKNNSSKFDYGRILIIAGSEKYSGAAALASNACISSGAGLVELFSSYFHPTLLAEIIQHKAIATKDGNISYSNLEYLRSIIEKYDVINIGPGLSDETETIELIKYIIYQYPHKKIIIDADGLKAIELGRKLHKNIVITPHIYEFINTFHLNKDEVIDNPHLFAKNIAREYNCVVLLKYYPTIITDGESSYYNINGNNGMATAGMGDVLTGIIAYYLSQFEDNLLATSFGAYIHSVCGDLYIKKYNKVSLTASKLIKHLREIDFGNN